MNSHSICSEQLHLIDTSHTYYLVLNVRKQWEDWYTLIWFLDRSILLLICVIIIHCNWYVNFVWTFLMLNDEVCTAATDKQRNTKTCRVKTKIRNRKTSTTPNYTWSTLAQKLWVNSVPRAIFFHLMPKIDFNNLHRFNWWKIH